MANSPVDYRTFYEFAVQNFPSESFSISDGVYAVAILSHEKSIIDVSPIDLHWFKVKESAYQKMTGTSVHFKLDGLPIADATLMRDIGAENKKSIIVLTSHEDSSVSAASSQDRKPLQPIDNNQLPTHSNPLYASRDKPIIKAEQIQNDELSQNESNTLLPHSRESVKPEIEADTTMSETEVQDVEPNVGLQNTRLQKLIEEANPEELEKEVKSSQAFLEALKKPLEANIGQLEDVKHWVAQISNLQEHKVDTPTIIGVVGNTGAGKSSVINAMLDEERLVPTNCMRACTAVVTEISYNSSEDPSAKYLGEIEFIEPADWEKDLKLSLAELKDDNGGISREVYNADSEAGIAYAKVRAVYPQKTKEELASSSVEELMNDPAVRNVLGTTKKVERPEPLSFYKALQHYVDSKEKSTETKKKKEKGEKKKQEVWPLIKVVRIFTKASALSTGAIVVDLPGVHDSNAARAAVAAGYLDNFGVPADVNPKVEAMYRIMDCCSQPFAVGRAVDDKSAKSLLGESFRRQLKYDGIYSRVTFICSKTDDISITEAADSLGLEDEMAADWERMDAIDKSLATLKQNIKDLGDSRAVYGAVINDADDAIEVWEEQAEGGETVWAPIDASKKRKRSTEPKESRKKSKTSKASDSGDDDDFIDDDDGESEAAEESDSPEDEDATSKKGDPLTLGAIEARIDEFKETKKKARRERAEIDAKVKDLKKQLADLDTTRSEIETVMSALCIDGRNKYSKGAIQTDFAAGIKELDQENAQEEDEANFNPDEDIRDYEEGRASNCRRFLTDFSQLLNSLSLWSSDDGTGLKLSSEKLAAEAQFLKSRLVRLDKNLELGVSECLREMKQTLAENIFENFDHVVQQAVDEATSTATRWGDRHMGGFYWATYKALCRRNGVFTNGKGPHDLNAQLTEPVIRGLASNWEKAFARRLPSVLQSFSKKSKSLLLAFHKEIEARCMKQGVGVAGLAMLGQQLRNYEGTFVNLTHEMVELINNLQREANREFTPVIANTLASAYEFCTAESGKGQYVRMKAHMTSHVDDNRTAMFTQSTEEVKDRLITMCRSVEERMANKADEVWSAMNRDYTQVISGTQLPEGQRMPKWERQLRGEVTKIIEDRAKAIEEADKEEHKVPASESETDPVKGEPSGTDVALSADVASAGNMDMT
ncbi:Nuclear GTPase SLIP-GC [Lachnellula willkommii]|uniref:Nuclear GTPase SLIP-GC n=1 Tax=Lachnellula willkommii TaxID=215461 RepID=A0A559MDV3_9HELO|nr:Nuclear GTPase SLIP-GC [Lachnellula willkommii]